MRHVREGLPDARRVLCAPTRPLRPRDHRCVPAPSARQGTRGTHPEAPGLPRLLTGCCIMHHAASSGKQNGFRIGDSRMGTGRAHRPPACQPGPRAHPENASAPHPNLPPRARTPRCPAAAPRSAGITPPHPTKVTRTRQAGHSPNRQGGRMRAGPSLDRRTRQGWTDGRSVGRRRSWTGRTLGRGSAGLPDDRAEVRRAGSEPGVTDSWWSRAPLAEDPPLTPARAE